MMKLRSWWVKTAVPLIHHHQLDLTSSLRCRQDKVGNRPGGLHGPSAWYVLGMAWHGDTHFFHVDLVFHKGTFEEKSTKIFNGIVVISS
ncbi:hypothetical protein QL285_024299 [Trifolium repens]|nr:hypothetical protein QL285_024299 [Trifolium repens]